MQPISLEIIYKIYDIYTYMYIFIIILFMYIKSDRFEQLIHLCTYVCIYVTIVIVFVTGCRDNLVEHDNYFHV